MVPIATESLINAILQKKETKFSNYPSRDEYWFILVEKFLFELDHYEAVKKVEFNSSFDRVFILREEEVIELNVVKPSEISSYYD